MARRQAEDAETLHGSGILVPIQLDDPLRGKSPAFEMLADTQRTDDLPDAVLQFADRTVIEMVPMVVADDEQVDRGHILRTIEVAARKSPVQKTQRSCAPENRVHEYPPSARKNQVGGVTEPNQPVLCGIEPPQVGPDSRNGLRGAQPLLRAEQESQHGPRAASAGSDLRGALAVAELPVAVIGRTFDPRQPLTAGQPSERGLVDEQRDRSGQQAGDSEKYEHDTSCFSIGHP